MSLAESRKLKIQSLNISEKKGTVKTPVQACQVNHDGLEGDAHAGFMNRQVSLLGMESIQKFSREADRTFMPGDFAENITTEGMDLYEASPLDRFSNENIILEITQIGKKCHGDNCAIFREVGNCIMPREGIFCRVLQGGALKKGDALTYSPKVFRALSITLSDRASRGEYTDLSGPALMDHFTKFCESESWNIKFEKHIIPDEDELFRNLLLMAEEEEVDFIFTTGGTGIGPRDITPEVVRPLLDKEIPGIMDYIRLKFGSEKHQALVSRSLCGVLGKSLVFCLPGSERAVKEYMQELNPSFRHLVMMLHGLDAH